MGSRPRIRGVSHGVNAGWATAGRDTGPYLQAPPPLRIPGSLPAREVRLTDVLAELNGCLRSNRNPLTRDLFPNGVLGNTRRSGDTFETVARMHGQERALMFASLGVGDSDEIHAEEEFIYPPNRSIVTALAGRGEFHRAPEPPARRPPPP